MSVPTENVLYSSALAVVFVVTCYICIWYSSTSRLRTPPGPKPKWISGNLHQLSKVEPWLTFASWSKEYGPIVYYRVFRDKTILLNSGKVVTDLLELRSSIYSDRPKPLKMLELAGRTRSVFGLPYRDARFKTFRRLLHNGLNSKAAKSYRPIQMQELDVLLRNLAESPESFVAHIRRNAVAIILKVAYGYQVSSDDEPLIKDLEKGFKLTASLVTPGKFWIEVFPILKHVPKWFPGAGFKRYAHFARQEMSLIESVPFDWVKKRIASGNFVESFTSKHILCEDGTIQDEDYLDSVKSCSAALYVGGGDTTVSAMISFFLLMSMNPEIQKQAQRDIDALNRLPTLDDYEALPYIRAIIKEVIRWAPVAPLGLAHKVMEDDFYEGYLIPKGTRIVANIWAITHDEEIYPDPFVFDPSRHLSDNPQPDPFKFVFGFGRRICPGSHLAEMSLFLNITNILAVFDISKAIDENGVEIDPKVEWTTGVTMHLKPFKCRIQPRSNEHLSLIG